MSTTPTQQPQTRLPNPVLVGKKIGAVTTIGLLSLTLSLSNGANKTAFAQGDSRSIPEIDWDTTLEKFQFDADKFIGQRLTVKCPPSPPNQSYEGVYGTGSYPSDSSICVAALHAGLITKMEGGTVTVQLNPGKSKYQGSDRNGVKTADLPETRRSMTFIDDSTSREAAAIHLSHIPRVDWDTNFTATGLAHRHLVGQRFTFRCSAAPSDLKPRIVYGTDSYDFASKICWAALHAGKITKEGGIVTVQINPGVLKLVGSIRNGVETKSKKGRDRSLTFVDNPVDKESSGDQSAKE